MRIRWYLSTAFAVILPFACSLSAADNADFTKTVPEPQAPLTTDNAGRTESPAAAQPRMFKGDKKAPKQFSMHNKDSKKKVRLGKKHGKAAKFDPQSGDSKKLSKQQIDKYAYRKSDSDKPGIPVTPAGSTGDATGNVK
jgi:hypothetical protein